MASVSAFSPSAIILWSFGYLGFLFAIAFFTDRLPLRWREKIIANPVIYTLSISVFCTSWTFYGAVGSAAKNGIDYVTIYLGPALVFFAWATVLRKMVRISQEQGITSIADFLSARFGKSARLSAVVTLIALISTVPYIALQLQAVTQSFEAIAALPAGEPTWPAELSFLRFVGDLGFWVALVMGLFVILFGARLIDPQERHTGVIAAIAFESLVKLIAFVAIGLLVIFALDLGRDVTSPARYQEATSAVLSLRENGALRWMAVLFLSTAAVLCLPRQFQVTVVENRSEKHLATASWMFPSYLFVVCLLTIPIAITGVLLLPVGSNPDMYVLTVPLQTGYTNWALLAYLGGLSSATSMVIVASIALSIMMSNHLFMPLLLRFNLFGIASRQSDLTGVLLGVRQLSIVLLLGLGYLYYSGSGSGAGLASIGLIAFAGVAQFFPALILGLYWKGASESGATLGMLAGFAVWFFLLFGPTLAGAGWILFSDLPDLGPWLQALGWDPLVFSLFWSLSANILIFVGLSIWTQQRPLERIQAALFVDVYDKGGQDRADLFQRQASVEDLYAIAERFLGKAKAYRSFKSYAQAQGRTGHLPEQDQSLVPFVERLLAGQIGASSARVMMGSVSKGETPSFESLITILDETQKAIAYSQALEQQSKQLEETAERLREANAQLRIMDERKDDFLSRVSHELRTPMTALRSTTEILIETPDLDQQEQDKFLSVIAVESKRLTRLLDEILDISRLEAGAVEPDLVSVDPVAVMRSAMQVLEGSARHKGVDVQDKLPQDYAFTVLADEDRLKQVFVNLITNAIKYNDSQKPALFLSARLEGKSILLDIADNGPGIAPDHQASLFTKFSRSWQDVAKTASGTGLGLAISKLLAEQMRGSLSVNSKLGRGSVFTLTLPLATLTAA